METRAWGLGIVRGRQGLAFPRTVFDLHVLSRGAIRRCDAVGRRNPRQSQKGASTTTGHKSKFCAIAGRDCHQRHAQSWHDTSSQAGRSRYCPRRRRNMRFPTVFACWPPAARVVAGADSGVVVSARRRPPLCRARLARTKHRCRFVHELEPAPLPRHRRDDPRLRDRLRLALRFLDARPAARPARGDDRERTQARQRDSIQAHLVGPRQDTIGTRSATAASAWALWPSPTKRRRSADVFSRRRSSPFNCRWRNSRRTEPGREGPGYWDYATSYNCIFLAALESALGTDFGLSQMPGFSETGLFPIFASGPTGKSFDYADAHAGVIRAPQLFWLARRFNRPEFAVYERNHASPEPSGSDLVRSARRRRDAGRSPAGQIFPPRGSGHAAQRLGRSERALGRLQGGRQQGQITVIWISAASCWKPWANAGLWIWVPTTTTCPAISATSAGPTTVSAPKDTTRSCLTPGKGRTRIRRPSPAIVRFQPGTDTPFAIADLTAAYKNHATKVERGIAMPERRQRVGAGRDRGRLAYRRLVVSPHACLSGNRRWQRQPSRCTASN